MHTDKVETFTIYHRNKEEFARLVDEIFVREEYKFTSSVKTPFVIDCGSHIGMSILYFKKLYPEARIIGFEPNPDNFKILQRNVAENNITNVQLINAALSDHEGTAELKTSKDKDEPWTWGDTIINNLRGDDSVHRKVVVPTVKLSDYITEPVDFMKMDVEGAEQIILSEIREKMPLIAKLDLEFHDTPSGRHVNDFNSVIKLLQGGGFIIETTARNKKIVFEDFAKYMRNTFGVYCVKCAIRATR